LFQQCQRRILAGSSVKPARTMRNRLLLFAACIVLLGCDDRSGRATGYQWSEKKQITESSEEDRDRSADLDDDGKPIDGRRSSANP
jgi:hypothetical protein